MMKQIKIAFVTTIPTDTISLVSALNTIRERYSEIAQARIWTDRDLEKLDSLEEFDRFVQTSHIAIVHLMGDLPQFDRLIASIKNSGVPVIVATSFLGQTKDYQSLSTVDFKEYQKIFRYLNYGGTKNFENLVLTLANLFIGAAYEVGIPMQSNWEGIYHPDFDYVPALEDYLKKKVQPGRLTVGVWFHQGQWQGSNISFIDSLIREIERQGASVLPVFFSGAKNINLGRKGLEWVIENYFMKDGKPIVDVIISALSFSLNASLSDVDVSVALKNLGVPIIKAITTFNNYEEWRDSPQGLSVLEIPANIAMPEFDGALITVPIAATTNLFKTNFETENKILKFEPIPERITKLVRLSLNWGKLRKLSSSEKKVAIIFHNYPPRNDIIGQAFGLDASSSVMNILQSLKKQGYLIDYIPESSQKLIEVILNGLTNDRRWASPEELAERAIAKISSEQYCKWFNELPSAVKEKMERDWGKPPGKLFSYNGTLLVSGIINGNVFIGLQPSRGYFENPSSIYHSPGLSMPHHYYGYYRWIRDVFKANVIIHMGTHGTLEWLPGKSVGLSDSCYPDIAISDLPNIYPYIITNPGEGTQAKRRSYCCIIDHLIPVMHNADSYDELAKLDAQLQEYYRAKMMNQEKLSILQKLIWQNVTQAKLDRDLKVTENFVFEDFDGFLERLHAYINELSDAQIRDGLHVLGEGPTDLRLEEFLVSLTRLSNGSVPSLRQSIAELRGYNYVDLLANRGKLNSGGKTNADILKELNSLSFELINKFRNECFNEQKIDRIIIDVLGESSPQVRKCLSYISVFLAPALVATADELTNTLSSLSGYYISPGPSGSITRGMVDVLPTGKNFYSIDPRTVPSLASWNVGVALGDALLERYLKEDGKYPESIGFVIWATDTIKTKGDDIAEILYLMGVKPLWEESSGRVVGVEAIPLETLKRPRVDVTVHISGLFRDTFPNVVHVIDDAVALVASLKESLEQNFVAKHVEIAVNESIIQGVGSDKAREEACYRIFGDRPGAYGCGVSEAIDSKKWREQKDLSDIYVNLGSYAYTRKIYGQKAIKQFERQLRNIDLTVKNQDSREYDILDSDDWYASHGGMINAVKAIGGKAPKSYCGDSSDPERVKVRSANEETCYVLRSRLLNPKWIESMKKHGYQGAADLSRTLDFVFGWDATVETVEDWMYEDLAKKYVLNKTMQDWLKAVNPYALQNMVERLLEAIERNMWRASNDLKLELQKLYLNVEGLLEAAGEKNGNRTDEKNERDH